MVFENSPALKVVLALGSALSYWNSITKQGYSIFYQSTFDWILSSLVLYHTRHVEKLLGPAKFIILQTMSTVVSGVVVFVLNKSPNLAFWALSTMVPYYLLIPYSHMTKFGVIPFTNKWYVYAFVLQMIITNPYYAVVPVCSILFYNNYSFKLKSNWLLKSDEVLNSVFRSGFNDQTFFGRQGRRFEQAPRQPRSNRVEGEPTPEINANGSTLRQLTDMGFTEDQARQALIQTNNNIEEALMILLASQ